MVTLEQRFLVAPRLRRLWFIAGDATAAVFLISFPFWRLCV